MNRTSTALLLSALTLGTLTGCKKEPDQASVHRNKGYALAKQAKYAEALAEYDQSLAADPNQDKLWEQKAFALIQTGDKDGAAAALEKVLALRADPKEKQKVYLNIASMYLQSMTPEKAEKYFLDALKLDPKNEQTLTWLGELHSQLGGARANEAPAVPEHLEKAISWYDQALTVNPVSMTAVANKRIALTKYLTWAQKEKATADADVEAAKKDPTLLADAQARAEKAQAKIAELQPLLDATTAKLTEVLKAQQGQKK